MSEAEPPESTGTDDEGEDLWARDTAPQTPYTAREVGIGLAIAVGLAVVAFGVPLVLG